MKRISITLAAILNFGWADSFINKIEYGHMLYNNPRGIGCNKCHGDFGEGRKLGSVEKKNKNIAIIAPKIATMTPAQIAQALSKKNSFMPSYQLTPTEVETLSYYLKVVNNNRVN